jgi:ABC-type molybdate transport system ATPase subunit
MVFQSFNLFPHLSVVQNCMYGHPSKAGAGAIAFDEVVALLGIEKLLQRSPRNLSGGERQRVAIGRALLTSPKLLLMDEPTAGMAPRERGELMRLVSGLAVERRMAVLFTEHDMDVVLGHAHRILVLSRGELIAQGKPEDVRADPQVREVYLGSQFDHA